MLRCFRDGISWRLIRHSITEKKKKNYREEQRDSEQELKKESKKEERGMEKEGREEGRKGGEKKTGQSGVCEKKPTQ